MGDVDLTATNEDWRQDWRGRVVLVTGAAGFLGGVVCRDLARRGANVLGLDNDWRDASRGPDPGVERVHNDVRDTAHTAALIDRHAVDTVIHLAARSLVGDGLDDPAETFSNNVAGTWSVLEACRGDRRIRAIVVASSDKAYGDWSGRVYYERMALRPTAPYDVSKAAADMIARSYAAAFGLPVGVTRCGNLYGGGDTNWSRIVPGTIRSVIRNERPVIRSDGTFVRDYLHVSDAARGVAELAAALRRRSELHGSAFNFAAGARVAALDLACRIVELMGSNLEPIVENRAKGEIREQRLSSTRARRELGWRPQVKLDSGLNEAIGWYRRHLGVA